MGALHGAPSKPTPAPARAVVWPECQSYPLFASLGSMPVIATCARRRSGQTATGRHTEPEPEAPRVYRGSCGGCEKIRARCHGSPSGLVRITVRHRKTLVTALSLAS